MKYMLRLNWRENKFQTMKKKNHLIALSVLIASLVGCNGGTDSSLLSLVATIPLLQPLHLLNNLRRRLEQLLLEQLSMVVSLLIR